MHECSAVTDSQRSCRGALAFIERHAEEVIAGACVCILSALVFIQVVMRFVFESPMFWTDEIAVYAMIWAIYLSCAWAVRERAHIRVMSVIDLFPGRVRLALIVVSDLIWFAFCIFITWYGILLVHSFWEFPYESAGLGINQKWPYMCISVGFTLTALRLIQVYYRWLRFDEPLLEPRRSERSEVVMHE